MKVGKNIPLEIIETSTDGNIGGKTFFDINYSNNVLLDNYAGKVNTEIENIKKKPSSDYIYAKKESQGYYTATSPSILALITDNIYVITLDKINDVGQVSLRINGTISKTLLKAKPYTGEVVDLSIGDMLPNTPYQFRYDGNIFIMLSSNSLSLGGKTIEDIVLKNSIVDNLNSTSTQAPISANQGKILDKKIADSAQEVDQNLSTVKSELQANIDLKAPINNPAFTGTVTGITKSMVGLNSADNTSDISKSVSTAQAEAIKVAQDIATTHVARTDNPHNGTAGQVGAYTKSETDARVKSVNDALITHGTDAVKHLNTAERNKWNDKYTKAEVDNKFSGFETAIDWKESVANFAAIATTYPTPQDGWTVNVLDTDYTYRYNGSTWVVISANSIPKATTSIDGLMTKENVVSLNDSTLQKHSHTNKAIIDNITTVLISNWTSAFTHISDALKHVTSAERTLWNNTAVAIDCGTFVDTIDDIMAHNEAMYTHNDMVFDGNTEALSTPPYDLETHSVDTYAHQNLIVDGNK